MQTHAAGESERRNGRLHDVQKIVGEIGWSLAAGKAAMKTANGLKPLPHLRNQQADIGDGNAVPVAREASALHAQDARDQSETVPDPMMNLGYQHVRSWRKQQFCGRRKFYGLVHYPEYLTERK